MGELPDSRMRQHAKKRGYILDSRARQFKDDDFAKFDYIIVMDEENYREISSRAKMMKNSERCCECATIL